MKITKRQLKRIISEIGPPPDMDAPGWGPNDTQNWEWQVRSEERRGIQDEYESWVKETGQITPAASSVMATFLLDTGLEDEHDLHQWLAGNYGMNHEDVMRDINRQQSEHAAVTGESKMRITKRQLRRMIKEESDMMRKRMQTGDAVGIQEASDIAEFLQQTHGLTFSRIGMDQLVKLLSALEDSGDLRR